MSTNPGERVTRRFQEDFAEFVRQNGPQHVLRWLEENLWPNLADVVNETIRTCRAIEDAQAVQGKLEESKNDY